MKKCFLYFTNALITASLSNLRHRITPIKPASVLAGLGVIAWTSSVDLGLHALTNLV